MVIGLLRILALDGWVMVGQFGVGDSRGALSSKIENGVRKS